MGVADDAASVEGQAGLAAQAFAEDDPLAVETAWVPPTDEYGVRALLLRIRAEEAQAAVVRDTLERLTAVYRDQLGRHSERVGAMRHAILDYLVATGQQKVALPDVGTVFQRKVPAKLGVLDTEAFRAWCKAHGHTKVVVDETAGKAAALGVGELPPGTVFVPEGVDVSIREAK